MNIIMLRAFLAQLPSLIAFLQEILSGDNGDDKKKGKGNVLMILLAGLIFYFVNSTITLTDNVKVLTAGKKKLELELTDLKGRVISLTNDRQNKQSTIDMLESRMALGKDVLADLREDKVALTEVVNKLNIEIGVLTKKECPSFKVPDISLSKLEAINEGNY